MKKNSAFTIVELVAVVVILAILSVIALPRFFDLQQDARESAIQGLAGEMNSAVNLVYSKSAIQGVEREGMAVLSEPRVRVTFGYPWATMKDLESVLDGVGQGQDFVQVGRGNDGGIPISNPWISIGFADYSDFCVKYSQATPEQPARVEVVANQDECSF